MRIPCPHCGPRDVREFSYLGDATLKRPDPAAPDARERFTEYVYLRDNPAARHRELWYHGSGCQTCLVVTRDVRDHAIFGAHPLKPPWGQPAHTGSEQPGGTRA
jgi:methylglutamate dehydrogenase subunit B